VKRSAQDVLLMVFGAILLHVGVTDLHLRFVKASMQPLIVVSALVLLGLAVTGMLSQARAVSAGTSQSIFTAPEVPRTEHDEHEGHAHEHGAPRTSWLLALPLFALLLVAPPALGADSVSRGASTLPVAPEYRFPPLPAVRDGAVDLSLREYGNRAAFEPESVQGTPVRLLGFSTPDQQGWVLARVSLSCCAADGRAATVRMTGEPALAAPPADSWWEVTGTYTPGVAEDGGVPALQVTSMTAVAAPDSQYDSY